MKLPIFLIILVCILTESMAIVLKKEIRNQKTDSQIFIGTEEFNILTVSQTQNPIVCEPPRILNDRQCQCPQKGIYLSGKCYSSTPKPSGDPLIDLKFINRKVDGSQNNQINPDWGSRFTNLWRLCQPNYQDGKTKMWTNRPSPRDVSNAVGVQQGKVTQSKFGLNMLFVIWGQFLDHDITFTPESGRQRADVPVPKCDQFMDPQCLGDKILQFTRSIFSGRKSSVRTNVNKITAWVDASNVYGSDEETASKLRNFKQGKMIVTKDNLLPPGDPVDTVNPHEVNTTENESNNNNSIAGNNTNGIDNNQTIKEHPTGPRFYFCGDVRCNQNVALTAFHTLFVRQHNRICDIVLKSNITNTDEQIYQIAKNYVTGLIQHITLDEWLPLFFGEKHFQKQVGKYKYDPYLNPNINTQFSTAGYRLGHAFLNTPYELKNNNGKTVRTLPIGEMFFNPTIFSNQLMIQLFNGLSRTIMKQRSIEIVDELRNFLFGTPISAIKFDLLAFNIQRGRDHGVCSINDIRQKLGLQKKTKFRDIFQKQTTADTLQKLFGDLQHVDLYLAVLGEKHLEGSILGQIGMKLNAMQFRKTIHGDRYWYQNVFPPEIIKQIKSTSLADVIKRNVDVKNFTSSAFKKF